MKKKFLNVFYILALLLVLIVIYSKFFKNIWWDAGVYFGMAKYIYSFGVNGMWESVRPIGWPLLIGAFWKLGFNIVYTAYILQVIMFLGLVYLTYLICEELFDSKVGFYASLVLGFNMILFFWMFKSYSDIPSTFFLVLAYYFVIKEKYYFLAGLSSAFSVLVRYPLAILLIPLGFWLLYETFKNKNFKNIFFYVLGFSIIALAFLLFNHNMYGHIFAPILEGFVSIGWNKGNPLIFESNLLLPLLTIILSFNIMIIFLFYGFYKIVKNQKFDYRIKLLTLALLLFLVFLEVIKLKEERYLIPIFFILSIFVGYGLSKIGYKLANSLCLVYIIIFLLSLSQFFIFSQDAATTQNFYSGGVPVDVLDVCPFYSEIASSNPIAAVYWDKVQPYYGNWSDEIIIGQENSIQCVFYSSCDFSGELPHFVFRGYTEFYKSNDTCDFRIFINT